MPHFLQSTKHRNSTDFHNSAFHYGHRTGLGFWEYLEEDPERSRIFNSGVQSLASVCDTLGSAGPYPFDEELEGEQLAETDVLIVDVGGGRGHVLAVIKLHSQASEGRWCYRTYQMSLNKSKQKVNCPPLCSQNCSVLV